MAQNRISTAVPEKSFLPLEKYQIADSEQKHSPWRRLFFGALFLTVGLAAATVGVKAITYQLTHLTVDNGLVNSRTVRLQTPIDGEIKDFYARSGAEVRAGQVLVRLAPGSQQQQTLLQLQGEVEAKSAHIAAIRQSLALVNQQLQSLDSQDQQLRAVNTVIASNQTDREQAAVAAAIASETAAKTTFQRYQQLAAEGGVSQQQVDQLQATWKISQAAVEQAKAALSAAQNSQRAVVSGLPLNQSNTLQQQRMTLLQTIQSQTTLLNTLAAERDSSQKLLKQTQSRYRDRQGLEVSAPAAGVIYSTERDAGEQVSRSEVLLTLLDCNDLWVETLVSVEQANQIDAQQPVRVQIGNADVMGDVELVAALSRAELSKAQAQALVPPVPAQLADQPVAKVRVRIPPTAQQEQSQQFCGVGQTVRLTFGTKMQLFSP